MIISRLGQPELLQDRRNLISDLIYVGVAECESGRILVVYNISYMLANKVWRNITIRQIRQILVPLNFCRLRYNLLRLPIHSYMHAYLRSFL